MSTPKFKVGGPTKFTTFLEKQGYVKQGGNMNPWTTEQNTEEQAQVRRYEVKCSEIHYFSYIIEATSPEEAEELARYGDYDSTGDDYDNYQVDNVTEIE